MNDLSEKIGLTVMIFLLLLLIVVSNFNIENNLNIDNSTNKHSQNNSNLFINQSIFNESQLNDTFNDSVKYSIYIQDINNSNTVMDLNSEEEYSSPITKNLLLNLAILNKYNPNSKLNISSYTKGKIINGSLYGDLILVLKGNTNILEYSLNLDPELKKLSNKIKKQGINQINGNILIDMGNQSQTKNLDIIVSPSLNGKPANVELIDNTTNLNIISNILTVNNTINESINIITNNSTIILNGFISNESNAVNLDVPINNSIDIKNSFISALNNESIIINNEMDIDYVGIYGDLLIKNNLINGNITNFTINTTNIDVKNSTLFINISFANNSSIRYYDYDLIDSLETKPLIDYVIPNLILFNESTNNNLIYVLSNNSNKSFEIGLKSLNEFLVDNNLNSNPLTKNRYEKSLVSPKLSINLLKYAYKQKYFSNFYNNMSSINGSNTIKILNNSLFYQNNNTILLNQSIIGYMDVKSSKIVFSIYLSNIEALNGNESEKIMNDTLNLLEKVYEKYN